MKIQSHNIKNLMVLVELNDKDIHQVLLNKTQMDSLLFILPQLFSGAISLIEEPLENIEIE